MKPLPSTMVSAKYPVTDGPAGSLFLLRALVNQQGVISRRSLGTFKLLISVLQPSDQPSEKKSPSPHPSFRAKETQWSMGLGSLKYMTPPSFTPSGRNHPQVPSLQDAQHVIYIV